jgi:phenylpyruvate tautomerase PptA (4-oxalocrotonate tautomerase family)
MTMPSSNVTSAKAGHDQKRALTKGLTNVVAEVGKMPKKTSSL